MSDDIYRRLANVLDTLPNGFPSTPNGVEIRILKKIFTPAEAVLFCDLRLALETAEQIAQRTNRSLDGLEATLASMAKRGEVLGIDFAGTQLFAMIPWAVGIYEYQIGRMDREFCELCEEYNMHFGPQVFALQPRIMQTVAIEEEIPATHQALPYQQVSSIVEKGAAFWVNECICKKERGMMGTPCTKPHDVCLAIGPVAGADLILEWGRSISKQEAYELLHQAEEAGLVHLTSNVASGHTFICNCCGCCCGVLRPMNEFGLPSVVNSYFCAEIEESECNGCGICVDERCQVKAIENVDETYRVVKERCIGCGLCVTKCPTDAIRLVPKPPAEITVPPDDVAAWNEERARKRGVDYCTYR